MQFDKQRSDPSPGPRSDGKRMKHFLVHLCLVVMSQSIVVSGYLNSINTTIERRYKLTSKEIGIIYMAYELSCIPTTIILSIIGDRFDRPRLLGASGLVMALGMLTFSLPHFIGSTYELLMCNENTTKVLCNNNLIIKSVDCAKKKTDTWALSIFCISQILIGVGASPIYLLGPSYLWDNLSIKAYSVYSSIFYTCSGLGPPIGFLLGGLFLGIYIDVPTYSKCENMNSTHALWLGAWWIGLLIIFVITVIFVAPLLNFQKDISQKKKKINFKPAQENTEVILLQSLSGDQIERPSHSKDVKGLPGEKLEEPKDTSKKFSIECVTIAFSTLVELYSNSVWLLISLTSIMEYSIVQGCSTFISKYLQVVFNVPANNASYIVGGIVVPGAITGVAFGGLIMNKLQPSISRSIRIMIITISSSGLMAFILMFLGCNNVNFVGVSVGYTNLTIKSNHDLVSKCNSHCSCVMENYEPICDKDQSRNFYSPCHAGCLSISNVSIHNLYYSNCACTESKVLLTGKCSPNCPTYHLTMAVMFAFVFLTATGQIPINIITLSSVDVQKSSLALGVQVFMIRLFAFIPVPLYFGALFDSICLVRIKDACNRGSICSEYNLFLLPYVWLGAIMCIKVLSLTFVVSTYICAKKKKIKHSNWRTSSKVNTSIMEIHDNYKRCVKLARN